MLFFACQQICDEHVFSKIAIAKFDCVIVEMIKYVLFQALVEQNIDDVNFVKYIIIYNMYDLRLISVMLFKIVNNIYIVNTFNIYDKYIVHFLE